MANWYELKHPNLVDSPALIVYPERVKHNINTLISMIDDVSRLRPHIKTNKSREACTLLVKARIRKFKTSTIAETEMLAGCGANDILLAYQPVGPKLKRFADTVKSFPQVKFSCLIDNAKAAVEMNSFFHSGGLTIDVFMDLNVGMNRTGIKPGEEAVRLYQQFNHAEGIHCIGLHVYDGHVRNVNWELRKKECDAAFEEVERMKQQLIERTIPQPLIIAGGTPTFSIHCKRAGIECSPGTFIYWDKGYQDLCGEQSFLPAALVITRVISKPDADRICVDLGHKSIASENELGKRVQFLDTESLVPVGHSEEHLVLQLPTGHSVTTGDLLYGLPFHICPTVALYERALVCENGEITGEWKTVARDKKINL